MIDSRIMDTVNELATLKRSAPQITGSRVMAALIRQDGISQQRVADGLGIKLQSLVQTLKVLEANGSITRARSEADRREMLVFITDKGRELMARHESHSQRCRRILAPLSQSEKETLLSLLTRVAEHNSREIKEGDEE